MGAFGPQGTLVRGLLPGELWDEKWYFFYATCVNFVSLIICIVGPKGIIIKPHKRYSV